MVRKYGMALGKSVASIRVYLVIIIIIFFLVNRSCLFTFRCCHFANYTYIFACAVDVYIE